MLLSSTLFSEGTRLHAVGRVCVKRRARLQQPAEACSRSAPVTEDQEVTFDLEGILICLKKLSS